MNDGVVPVSGLFRGVEGETQHVCWECPVCGRSYSDDFSADLAEQYLEQCGNAKQHPAGAPIRVSVAWRGVRSG